MRLERRQNESKETQTEDDRGGETQTEIQRDVPGHRGRLKQ